MKRLIALLLLACPLLAPAHAQPTTDQDPLPEASWTITPAVTSQYLFRGVRVAGACFQPAVDYEYGPLSLGVWSSLALEDRADGDSDPEVDFYGAYTIPVGETGLELVPGVQWYTYPDANREDGYYRSTVEPSLALNVLVKGIQITPKYYYDLMLHGATYECSAEAALPLTALGTELGLSASVGTFKWRKGVADVSPDVKNWGDYWTIGASVPYQVTKNSSLTLAVTYSEGRNNYFKQGTDPKEPNVSAVGRAAVTLSYSISL